jgi:glycosyltransferase involved in cell wall biosynthesis
MSAEFQVLHLRSSAGLYGAEYVILGLLPALAEGAIDARLLCLDNPRVATQALCAKAQELGVPCERLPCQGRFDFATVSALRRVLAAQANPLLHVHDYKSALVAWLARGRRKLPIIATSLGQFSSTLSLHLYHRLELSLMRRFDRIGIVSADMRPILMRAGVAAARIVLVENGIDTRRFAPQARPFARADFGIAENATVFGAAMRLTEQKNPLQLVQAFAQLASRLPDAVLAIAGEGVLHDAVRDCAAAAGVGGRVHLLGALDALERFYAMLDVFVLPSRYEGLPLALLDGLAVAPVPPGDVAALAAAMHRAATRPAPVQALRARVVERYSVQRMARDYAALYRDVWRSHERAAA